MKYRSLLAVLLLFSVAASAQVSEYARQWPVSATGEGAYSVQLDESIYRQLSRNDLSDLAAYNADGQALAFGPMPASYSPPPASWREAAWFALPASQGGTLAGPGDDLHLHVRRTASGELSLDANLGGAVANDGAHTVEAVLVDVLAKQQTVEAIAFDWMPDAPDFNMQVGIEASEDLEHWQTIIPSATLAQLHQGGRALARALVEFAPLEASYLRVRSLTSGQSIPLQSLRLELRPKGPRPPNPPRQWTSADFVERQGNAFVYRLPARIPVEQIAVALADDNALAEITISTRDDPDAAWRHVGHVNAFRLRGAGLELDNEPLDVATLRSSHWRIETVAGNDLGKPPVLKFGWRPESWLLLTHGAAPYVVVAGSQRARRQEFPLDMLVGQVRSKYGNDWQPAVVALGAMKEAGGESALRGYDPAQKRTWVLWGILLLGALVIVAMVLKLLKSKPGD